PFESHFLNLDGLRYHYLDEGSGEPLLFVHGNPSWSFAWRNLVKEFSRDHRCIAVDHIGCGFSDKPQDYAYRLENHVRNLETLIERLDLRNITLVAHDWGGAIGMGAATRHPDRFSRLVLMNTAAFRSKAIPWRIAACRIPMFGPLAVRGLNGFAGAATFMAVEKPMSPAVKAGYLKPYDSWKNRIATLRFVEDIPLTPSHPSYATLTQIEEALPKLTSKPMLLVWGMKDWCFTPAFLEKFERRFPHAESLRIADAGHYVFEDAPERIVPRMREFFATKDVADPPLSTGERGRG
nr:alpha/beta fold hydrolase [Planctomycetota bacterium]